MQQKQTPRWLFITLATLFLYSVVPLVWMCAYVQPQADDYWYADLLGGLPFPKYLKAHYDVFSGRMGSALLMWFDPSFFKGFTAYKITCAVFLLLFLANAKLLTDAALPGLKRTDRWNVFFLCIITFNAGLSNVAEFYYWFPAITNYGIGALGIGWFWLISRYMVQAASPHVSHLLIGILLSVILPQCNETAGLIMLSIMAGNILLYREGMTKRKAIYYLFFALLIIVAVAVLSLAPSNVLRATLVPHRRSIVLSIAGGIYAFLQHSVNWMAVLIPAMLLYTAAFRYSNNLNRQSFRKTLKGFIWHIIAIAAMEMLIFYSMGGMPAERVQNLIWCYLLLSAAVALAGILRPPLEFIPARHNSAAIVLTMFIAAQQLDSRNAATRAWMELISGVPQQYDREMHAMYEAVAASPDSIARVPVVHHIPATLFVPEPVPLAPQIHYQVHFAHVFGKTRILTDTGAIINGAEASFKARLMQARR